ncbi:hypothetical protein Taro_021852 [Colocasia esculenta]|uniref:Uncharacterized protein n=1 Tax=Colocasia esculenta TaxID=4460 RepID=A0A843V024_COLES|nr:hypothetical protein [Colocasia esculenta]
MNFDVPYEDMVRGARSGSSFGRRLSSGRGSSTASGMLGSVYASSSYGSRIVSSHASYVSYPHDRLGSVYTSSSYGSRTECVRTSNFFGKRIYGARESRPDCLEGAHTDMDEERVLAKSVQHMGRREMARNLHNNESESGCQSRGQQAYKWDSYSQQMTKKYVGEEEQPQLDPLV